MSGDGPHGQASLSKPASAMRAFETVSISNSRLRMNSSRGRPVGQAGEEFDHRRAGSAQDAALGPEDADVGGDRHAGLAELFVEDGGADLVGHLDPRGDAGALRVDDELAGLAPPLLHIRHHLGDGLPALAPVDRHAADPPGVLAEDRGEEKLALHDELATGDGVEDHEDVEEGLVLGRDHHLVRGRRAAHLDFEPHHPAGGPDDPGAEVVAGGVGAFAGNQRVGQVDDGEDRHGGVHADVEGE
jgi:hypothetical protein